MKGVRQMLRNFDQIIVVRTWHTHSRMCMRISMAHAVLHNHGLANPVDFHSTRRLLLVFQYDESPVTTAVKE